MRCPRCGKEYQRYDILGYPDVGAKFFCNGCDTHIVVDITQALLNLTYSLMDMGFVHDDAKVGA